MFIKFINKLRLKKILPSFKAFSNIPVSFFISNVVVHFFGLYPCLAVLFRHNYFKFELAL